ncbi:hypothetical protein LINGRAHAP2_LOCUS22156 [Linum grandiflorum]
MIIKNSHMFLVFLIVSAALLPSTTCRPIDDNERGPHRNMFLRGVSTIRKSFEEFKKNVESESKDKSTSSSSYKFHSVSRRLVPGGPNLLHN